jgi:hypothetical protein
MAMIQASRQHKKQPLKTGYYWIRDRRGMDESPNGLAAETKIGLAAQWELAYWNGVSLTIFTPEHHLQPTWTVVYDPELEYWLTRPLDPFYCECLPVDWIAIPTPRDYPANQSQPPSFQ